MSDRRVIEVSARYPTGSANQPPDHLPRVCLTDIKVRGPDISLWWHPLPESGHLYETLVLLLHDAIIPIALP